MIDTPLKLAAACPFQQTYSPNFRDEPKVFYVTTIGEVQVPIILFHCSK
jgi:hypothetical protein